MAEVSVGSILCAMWGHPCPAYVTTANTLPRQVFCACGQRSYGWIGPHHAAQNLGASDA